MDSLDLLIGARVEWVSDNLTIHNVRPRHLGQPVTFFYYDSSDDEKNYEGVNVVGLLEGAVGDEFIVSGDGYKEKRVGAMKVWRKVAGK